MYKFLRNSIFRYLNLYIGKLIGFKLRRTTYSRPSTILAKKIFGDKPLRVIEIGCASGNNALDILKNLNVKEIVLIDPYEKALTEYDDYTSARLKKMRQQSAERLSQYSHKITWLYELSDDAISRLEGQYDFIYVDGDHSYEATAKDLSNYSKFLSQEHVFAGHDVDNEGVTKAFIEYSHDSEASTPKIQEPDWIFYSHQK